MRVQLKGVFHVRKKLADEEVLDYWYAWRRTIEELKGISWNGATRYRNTPRAKRITPSPYLPVRFRGRWTVGHSGTSSSACVGCASTASSSSSPMITPAFAWRCARSCRKRSFSGALCTSAATPSITCRARPMTTACRNCAWRYGDPSTRPAARLAAWITKWGMRFLRLVGGVEEIIEETLIFYQSSRPAVQFRLKESDELSDFITLVSHLINDVAFRFWYNWYSSDARAEIEELQRFQRGTEGPGAVLASFSMEVGCACEPRCLHCLRPDGSAD
jgi:hypothetical protein